MPHNLKQYNNNIVESPIAEQDYDYSHLSDFNEGVEEVHTDSDINSSEEDGDSFLTTLKNRIQAWSQSSPMY